MVQSPKPLHGQLPPDAPNRPQKTLHGQKARHAQKALHGQKALHSQLLKPYTASLTGSPPAAFGSPRNS